MAPRLRLGFMGTPEFAVRPLQSLANIHDIAIVVSQPDRPKGRGLEVQPTPVKKAATLLGLKVVQPERLDLSVEQQLATLVLDAIVVVAYGQILKPSLLKIPRLGCINIHASLLPRWRGAAPIQWAILSGDPATGITTMQMDQGLDTGDMLESRPFMIGATETAAHLAGRLSELGADLILSTLEKLAAGQIKSQPQIGEATYAHKLTKEMGELDLQKPAEELFRKIRAFDPWPGTSVKIHGKPGEAPRRLKILSAALSTESLAPGSIRCTGVRVLLGTGHGCLELLRMQWEGKKPVGPQEFSAGWQTS